MLAVIVENSSHLELDVKGLTELLVRVDFWRFVAVYRLKVAKNRFFAEEKAVRLVDSAPVITGQLA